MFTVYIQPSYHITCIHSTYIHLSSYMSESYLKYWEYTSKVGLGEITGRTGIYIHMYIQKKYIECFEKLIYLYASLYMSIFQMPDNFESLAVELCQLPEMGIVSLPLPGFASLPATRSQYWKRVIVSSWLRPAFIKFLKCSSPMLDMNTVMFLFVLK